MPISIETILTFIAEHTREAFWIIVGVVYSGVAIVYFRLAYKAQQKISLTNLQIDRLCEDSFMPRKKDVAIEGYPNGTVRTTALKPIADYVNNLAESVEKHINHSILPRVKTYLDKTSKIATKGFIAAGALATVAASLAFLSAFLFL